ncbi:translocon-associated protein subunit beta [Nilaparvata lugens]|uniref:translocon-associated protein subunit beta n=1 Tax=Nilaparvata lugens TaxID=108931 RepID=UPI00193CD126|nr:translocon-associated protein subunit beta [Nilaparvata lugens]
MVVVTLQCDQKAEDERPMKISRRKLLVLSPKNAERRKVKASGGIVNYKPIEDAKQVQVAVTSEPGEGLIIAYIDFDKKFSPHLIDWGAFALMALPSLGIPFLLWWTSKNKYEKMNKPKKDKGSKE